MWPDESALEHFLECLSPRAQLELWGNVRKQADQGIACLLVGHRERVESLTQQLFRLILGIRKLRVDLSRGLSDQYPDETGPTQGEVYQRLNMLMGEQ